MFIKLTLVLILYTILGHRLLHQNHRITEMDSVNTTIWLE